MTLCLSGDGNPSAFMGFCVSCKLNMGDGAKLILLSGVGTIAQRQARVAQLMKERATKQTFRGRHKRRHAGS